MIFKKQIIQPLHLISGLCIGIIVIIVSVTGCLYVFEQEIRSFIYSDIIYIKPSTAEKLTLSHQIVRAKLKYPDLKLEGIRINSSVNLATELAFENSMVIYINPYSGKIQGCINRKDDFFGKILNIHRSLFLGKVGKRITGLSAFAVLGMLLSGIILWWPKGIWQRIQKFRILWKANSFKRTYDLHSVLGFYASGILIFTVLSGLLWSFRWVENSMFYFLRSKPEVKTELNWKSSTSTDLSSIDKIFNETQKHFPNFNELIIQFPSKPENDIKLIVENGQSGLLRNQSAIFFKSSDGSYQSDQLFENKSLKEKIRNTNYQIHTGKILGLPGQLLAFFASFILGSLPITGFLMWWNKRKMRIKSSPKSN